MKWRAILIVFLALALVLAAAAGTIAQVTTPSPTPTGLIFASTPTPTGDALVMTPVPLTQGTPTATITPTDELTPTEQLTPTPRVTPTDELTPTTPITPSEGLTPTIPITPTEELTPTVPMTGTLSERIKGNLLENYALLDSYRIETTLGWQIDTGSRGNAQILTEIVNQPPAQRWLIEINEEGAEPQNFEIIRFNGETYARVGNADWTAVTPTLVVLLNRLQWLTDPAEFVDLQAGRFIEEETVNGFVSERYRYGFRAFEPAQRHIQLSSAQADVWYSIEHQVWSRADMRLVGTDAIGNRGVFTLRSDLVAVNEPVAIEPPALPETGPETEMILNNALGLGMLNTYRVEATFAWQIERGQDGSAWLEAEVSNIQGAERATLEVGLGFLLLQRIEYVNIDGEGYIRQGREWMSAAEFAAPELLARLGWIGNPENFLAEDAGIEVGEEEVDGLMTTHYRFNTEAFGPVLWLVAVEDGFADVWWSEEHEAYVRAIVHVEGPNGQGDYSVIDMESHIVDIDEPLMIERPADLPPSPAQTDMARR
ncbi:MAG: hypothetical protein ACYC5M_14960 [Anaerolineae bacterium]